MAGDLSITITLRPYNLYVLCGYCNIRVAQWELIIGDTEPDYWCDECLGVE